MTRVFKKYSSFLLIIIMILSMFNVAPKVAMASESLKVRRVYPSEDVKNVSTDSYICFDFNDAIEEGSNFDKISFKDSKGKNISYSADITSTGIIIKSDSRLGYETNYDITIPDGAVKQYKSPHDKNREYEYSFKTTTNRTPLRVNNISPSHRHRIEIKGEVSISFSKDIQSYYNFGDIVMRDTEGNDVSIKAEIKENELKIKPSKDMDYNSNYYIYIPENCIRDKGNENNNNAVVIPIITEYDTKIPTIKTSTPKDGEKAFDISKQIIIEFDKKIHESDDFTNIKILDSDKDAIGRRLTIDGEKLIIDPYSLKNSATYTVKIPSDAVYNIGGKPDQFTNEKSSFTFTTSADKTLAELKSSSPLNKSKYIPIDSSISIRFSENITIPTDSNKSKNNGITLRDSKGDVPIDIKVSGDNLNVKLKDGINLAYNTQYTLNVSSSALKDYDGNALKQAYTVTFLTEGQSLNPKFINAEPQNESENFNASESIKVYFSSSIRQGDRFNDIVIKDTNNNIVPSTKTYGNNILYITPLKKLDYNSKYTYYIPSCALKDLNGNLQLQDYNMTFKTQGEKGDLSALSTFPMDGNSNIAVDTNIIVAFNKKIQQGAGIKDIKLSKVGGDDIPTSFELKEDKLIIHPINNLNLEFDKSYRLYIPLDAVKDMNGSEMSKSISSGFITGNNRFCPIIANASVYNNTDKIPITGTLNLIFNDTIKQNDNFKDIVLMDSNNKKVDANISLWDRNLNIKPLKNLNYISKYKIVIPENSVKDSYNNINKDKYDLNFTTENENKPPYVISAVPANLSRDVDVKAAINIKFNENIKLSDANTKEIKLIDFASRNVPVDISVSNNVLTAKPKSILQMNKNYVLMVSRDAIKDLADNTMQGKDYLYTFTTVSKERLAQKQIAEKKRQEQEKKARELKEKIANDKTPPQVVNGGFSKDYKTITVIFSENILAGADYRNIQIIDVAKNKKLPILAAVKGKTLTVKIRGNIKKGTQYGLIVPSKGIKDIAGNTMQQDIKAGFTKPN